MGWPLISSTVPRIVLGLGPESGRGTGTVRPPPMDTPGAAGCCGICAIACRVRISIERIAKKYLRIDRSVRKSIVPTFYLEVSEPPFPCLHTDPARCG